MAVHPIALAVVLLVSVALLSFRRERLLTPFFLVAVFLPLAQGFQLAGLDFNFARFLLFVAWLRFLIRGELRLDGWNAMDRAMLLWCSVGAVTYVALWGTFDAVINRLGYVLNYAGTYFVVRLSVQRTSDVAHLFKYMRLAAVLLGAFMMVEALTARNLFAVFGGVPAITVIRDERLRSQGPFGHPIAAGLFAASLIPIFFGLIAAGTQRLRNGVAFVFALFAVAATASSGPVLGLAAAVVAWCFWPVKRHMRTVAWATVACLVALHVAMKAPVWALIQRVSVFGASSGYHRFNLFDQFIRRFDEWWLFGTRSTDHWGYFSEDVANNYVRIGVNGGVFTVLAFLLLLRLGFVSLGAAIRHTEDKKEQMLLWSLGASLFVHVVGSFGLSYWDQGMFLFALLLGLVSAASTSALSDRANASLPKQFQILERDGARAWSAQPVFAADRATPPTPRFAHWTFRRATSRVGSPPSVTTPKLP